MSIATISLYPEYNYLYFAQYLCTVPDLYLMITSNYFVVLSNFYFTITCMPITVKLVAIVAGTSIISI